MDIIKNGPFPASFCLFLFFSRYNFNTNRKKHRWCALDSNPGLQGADETTTIHCVQKSLVTTHVADLKSGWHLFLLIFHISTALSILFLPQLFQNSMFTFEQKVAFVKSPFRQFSCVLSASEPTYLPNSSLFKESMIGLIAANFLPYLPTPPILVPPTSLTR